MAAWRSIACRSQRVIGRACRIDGPPSCQDMTMTPRGRVVQSGPMPVRCLVRPGRTSTRWCSCGSRRTSGRVPVCARRAWSWRPRRTRTCSRPPACSRTTPRPRRRTTRGRHRRGRGCLDDALDAAEEALSGRARRRRGRGRARRPRTLAEAAGAGGRGAGRPRRDLDPGRYAAAEALKALASGSTPSSSATTCRSPRRSSSSAGARARPDRHGAGLRDGDRRRRAARLRQRGPRRRHRADRRVRDRAAAGRA